MRGAISTVMRCRRSHELHGMLNHIRDPGLPLLAVDRIEPGGESAVDTELSDDR